MSVGVNLATVPSLIQLSGGMAVILKMATRDLEGTMETRVDAQTVQIYVGHIKLTMCNLIRFYHEGVAIKMADVIM